MKMRAPAAAGVALLVFGLAGCGLAGGGGSMRYADFTLPAPEGAREQVAFAWEVQKDPVLTRGTSAANSGTQASGAWDSVDVLNPSVVVHQGMYWNLYSGFDGKTWHTGAATSRDGREWQKRGKVLSPAGAKEGTYIAANGSALVEGGKFVYWYEAGDPLRIFRADSSDGLNWTRAPDAVLEPGPSGSWDERGVADPYVIRSGADLYLFYLGQDRARRQRLGIARSSDGITWTKLRSNPVLEVGADGAFDENGLGEPAVWSGHGRWWMLYTGRDRGEIRRIGLASSTDGVKWERVAGFIVLAGAEPWNAKVVCDPAVEKFDGGVRVWFGGGDVAHPAENIHGQIGFAVLHMTRR